MKTSVSLLFIFQEKRFSLMGPLKEYSSDEPTNINLLECHIYYIITDSAISKTIINVNPKTTFLKLRNFSNLKCQSA